MVKIDLEALRMVDDVEFSRQLQAETGVGVLPGSCFGAPGFCRIVTAAPASELEQAWDRLGGFMERHYVKQLSTEATGNCPCCAPPAE